MSDNVKNNKQMYELIFDNFLDAIFVYELTSFDKPGFFIDVNSVACERLGYNKEELLNKTLFDIDSLKSLGDLLYVHKILAETKKVIFETIHKTKNGKEIPVEISAHVSNINGADLVFAIARDITKRREAENALSASEKKYKALVEYANDGILLIYDNLIEFANKSAADMLETNVPNLKDLNIKEIVPEDVSKELSLVDVTEQIINTGENQIYREIKLETKNGNKIDAIFSGAIIESKNKKCVIAFIKDITKQKREREELRQMAYFAQHNPSPLIRFDKSGNVILANAAAHNIMCSEMVRCHLHVKNLLPEFENFDYKNIIENGDIFYREIKVNDRYYNFTISGVPSLNIGQIYGSDITAIKNVEKEREMLILELEKANKDLSELSKMKDDFISIVSHDLRSPFNGILGFTELLLDDESLSEKHKEYVELIRESSEIQLKYINDLLDLIAAERREIKITASSASIDKLVDTSIKLLNPIANKKDITIKKEIKDNIKILMDFPKMTQVINNLITNAIKFTPNGGQITIKSFKTKNNTVEIHVVDNGTGITEKEQNKLFNRYTKVQKKGTDGESGSGLGLSISKKLVEAHNGEIKIKSKIKKGSDFYIILPIK